jgi:ABC-2 type transport system ATP-binding protein
MADAGTTVVFSTHQMDQAERLCDSVCIIARGQKVVDGPLAEVKRNHGGEHVVVAVADGLAAVDRLLADRTLVARADSYGKYAEIELAKGCDSQRLLNELVGTGARITRFELAEPSLNKIFLDRVGADASVAAISRNQ